MTTQFSMPASGVVKVVIAQSGLFIIFINEGFLFALLLSRSTRRFIGVASLGFECIGWVSKRAIGYQNLQRRQPNSSRISCGAVLKR